jgi:type II secretory pathway component GspD/PulD (secretin)
MKLPTVHMFRLLLCLAISVAMAVPSMAQRSDRRGSELDLLRSENVLQEIGVSDELISEIDELRRNTSTTRAAFEEFKEEMRAAKTEVERAAIRQKIQDAVKGGGTKFQLQALDLLNTDQRTQLRRVFIENYGLSALVDDRVAADLELSEDQRGQIKELMESRRKAEPDNELSDEDRDVAQKQFDEQLLAVLSEKQLATWIQQAAVAEATSGTAEQPDRESSSQSPAVTMNSSTPGTGDAVASFGTRVARSGQKVKSFSFNFRNAPWERVLQMFADGSGLTLDMQRVPPGSLSHLDQQQYSSTRALDIMNGYLIRKGFGIVEKDGFLIVVNLDEQLDQSLIPEFTLEELRKTGDEKVVEDHQLVTVRVPVEGLDTARTAQEVEALLGPWGSLIALTQSQVMMVTDIGANLRRIMGLLGSAARPDELIFTSYHLKSIDVEDAEPLLLTQFGMRQAATNVSSAVESRSYRDRRSREERSRTPAPTVPASPDNLQVAADVRTNSLLVTGTPAQHLLVKTILTAIDVSEGPDGQALARTGRRGKYLMVYDVSSADAREVTKTLDAIMSGVVVNEDGRNGKIHIMATEREHEEVAQLIRQLDGAGGRQSVAVIPLVKMDPLMAAATLRSLFVSEGTEAPTIETDLYGRRLIIRGEPDQVTQIKAVLAQLGEDGTGARLPSQSGRQRRYSLQGRSPDEFLRILQDTWKYSEPNPIRIVVPARSGPVQGRRTSDGAVDPVESESPQDTGESTFNDAIRFNENDSAYLTVAVQVDDASDDGQNDSPEVDDVVITVLGDDLLLTSDDPEALDRLEELLDSLQQTLPYRTRWTIFYLQAADATEAADMLAQIFPSSSVASTVASTGSSIFGSLANSFSGIGNSLVDATGLGSLGESPQTLRIIPDVRSNSLLISGPAAVLQDVWAMLNVLDSNDIPESFRDMQQRTISLKHANIDNVVGIIRDVYKPLMEAQDTGRQQQNPFAAMLGAGGSSKETKIVRMTLGVDRQTSSLIVSSSQDIFDDVKELAETLDKNAMSANRRIRVVQLRSVDPEVVQKSLTGLFPRVSTSVSTIRTSGTGGGTDANSDNQAKRNESEDGQRTEAIRRFRERMENQQGDDGGRGAGGRGGRQRNR